MKKVVIIPGSVRKTRAADKVLEQVVTAVQASGAEANVADLRELNIPMFDSAIVPSDPNYEPAYDVVKTLMHDVAAADGVVLLVPEYNGMMSAALKNVFDWLGKAWAETPVAAVGYNWHADGHGGLDNIRCLMHRVKAAMPAEDVHLVFGRDVEANGAAIDEAAVQDKLRRSVDALLQA